MSKERELLIRVRPDTPGGAEVEVHCKGINSVEALGFMHIVIDSHLKDHIRTISTHDTGCACPGDGDEGGGSSSSKIEDFPG